MAAVPMEWWEQYDQDHADAVGFLRGEEQVFLAGIRKIFVWDRKTGRCLGDVYHSTQSTMFPLGAGEFACVVDSLRTFEVVMANGRPVLKPFGTRRHNTRRFEVEAMAGHSDSGYLALGMSRGHIELVHEKEGLLAILTEGADEERAKMAEWFGGGLTCYVSSRKESAPVLALGLSNAGLTITAFHRDGTLRIWEAGKKKNE